MVTRARQAASVNEPAPSPTSKTKVNILVVDDDATKRFALRTILAPLDENVIEASSGADALRQLLRNEFAVVLLDVRMPIMDGFETAPLVSFDGLSQALLEKYGQQLDDEAKDYLKRMRDASERMTSVFDGLQMLFRLTSGEMRREEVDISALAANIMDEMRNAYPDSKVEVDIAPGITASGDRRLVRILLTNLINNAWKFSSLRGAPRIAIGREMVDGEARIFVKDNGAGFDMIDSHRLFGAFQRLHSQSEFPGAGIGLATGRRIVNRHGGRIWAEGAVGEGATFYFVL